MNVILYATLSIINKIEHFNYLKNMYFMWKNRVKYMKRFSHYVTLKIKCHFLVQTYIFISGKMRQQRFWYLINP